MIPVPCRFAVIGFGVRWFTGDRVDGPGASAGGVQLPLFLLRELFIGDEFFHSVSFLRLLLVSCLKFIISQVSRGIPIPPHSKGGLKGLGYSRVFSF